LFPTGLASAGSPNGSQPEGSQEVCDPEQHLRTEHLRADLFGRSVRGGAVTLSAQAGKFALRLTETIVLARLLGPEAFGLIAMVMAVTGFLQMFKEGGLSMATVQRENVTHAQVSTLFWVNLSLSAALTVLVIALAPGVAWLYGEPRLTPIALALAGTFLLTGLGIQHGAVLKRQMRFKALAATDLTSMALGVAGAITAAVLGAGYWALVVLHLVQSIVRPVMLWTLCHWRPGLPQRGTGVRPMAAFGGNLTASRFCNMLARKADDLLLGMAWGAGPLGLYTVAYRLLTFPIQQINGPISQTMQPALSRVQSNPEQFRRFYRRALEGVVSLSMPVAVFAVICAKEIILLGFGEKWVEAVPIFQALAPAAIVGSLNVSTGWIFVPLGQTRRQLTITIAGSSITVAAVALGLQWGALGVALGFSISELIKKPVQLAYACQRACIKLLDIGKALWRPSISSVLSAIGSLIVVGYVQTKSDVTILLLSGFVFATIYVLVISVLPGAFDTSRIWLMVKHGNVNRGLH